MRGKVNDPVLGEITFLGEVLECGLVALPPSRMSLTGAPRAEADLAQLVGAFRKRFLSTDVLDIDAAASKEFTQTTDGAPPSRRSHLQLQWSRAVFVAAAALCFVVLSTLRIVLATIEQGVADPE